MSALSTVTLVICSLVGIILRNGCSALELSAHATTCPPYQTQCRLGCCPFKDGVCCADGFECCQQGQTCIPYIGICVGLINDAKGGKSLFSRKSTPVEKLVTGCPPSTTSCGEDKCCTFSQATCCSDGEHCCPYGYSCELQLHICIRDSINSLQIGMAALPIAKVAKNSPLKACPGTGKMCPTHSSCCTADYGQKSCCRNLSLGPLGVAYKDEEDFTLNNLDAELMLVHAIQSLNSRDKKQSSFLRLLKVQK